VRHSQNDGYVIAVDLNDKKYDGFTWEIHPLKPSHRLKNF